jgi:hypothetical protein
MIGILTQGLNIETLATNVAAKKSEVDHEDAPEQPLLQNQNHAPDRTP